MKQTIIVTLTILSSIIAQADIGYEIPPHVAYYCNQQNGQTKENLLLPKITQVESTAAETQFKMTLSNFNCVNGTAVPTNSAGLGTPWFKDLDFGYNQETPMAFMNKMNPIVYEATITVNNDILAQKNPRRFQMMIPFGFSQYLMNIVYKKSTATPTPPTQPPAPASYTVQLF